MFFLHIYKSSIESPFSVEPKRSPFGTTGVFACLKRLHMMMYFAYVREMILYTIVAFYFAGACWLVRRGALFTSSKRKRQTQVHFLWRLFSTPRLLTPPSPKRTHVDILFGPTLRRIAVDTYIQWSLHYINGWMAYGSSVSWRGKER